MESKKIFTLSILVVMALSFVFAAISTGQQQQSDFSDFVGKLSLVIIPLIGILIVQKLSTYDDTIYFTLSIGFFLFFIGCLDTFMDDFYTFSLSLFKISFDLEDITWVGMSLGCFGLFKWINLIDSQKKELLSLNNNLIVTSNDLKTKQSKLEETEKKLEEKNKELETTLEDFYTFRISIKKKGDLKKDSTNLRKKKQK